MTNNSEPGSSAQLERGLGLAHVFCIASGAMISSGIFILPGLAYAKAGPAVIISYFLAGLLSIPGMLSIAEMTTAMPRAGGDCFTIMRSMGPGVGTVAGLLSWFSLSMKTAFALVGMSVFAVAVVNVNFHVVAIAGCLFFLAVNILGIKEAGGLQVLLVIGLFGLMVLYIILGLPRVNLENFDPVAPKGLTSVFFTAGFVFVSYAGLLKVASVAEEIKNPSRNIPLGMILALVIVSLCYTLMVFVTAGVLDSGTLSGSLTPISDGAYVFMGTPGRVALSVAALLAFLTTANAGIMTAARSLVPLSRDRLFPGVFANIGQRFKTPHNALLLTGGFIIVFLFVKLEILVEAASVVLILTNLLSCLSVIILRESGLQNYRPGFRAPLYPWLQIAGIVGFSFILLEMGEEAFFISALLILGGFCAYWFYGRKRVRTESAVVHLVRRIADKVLVTGTLEAELKQIVRERDDIVLDRFDHLVEQSVVLDMEDSLPVEDFFGLVGRELGPQLNLAGPALTDLLLAREGESSSVVSQGLAIPHVVVEGKQNFRILLARCQGGIVFSQDVAPVQMAFVLAGTRDERNFHLQVLAAIGKIIQQPGLKSKWMAARGEQALRDVILLAERRRH